MIRKLVLPALAAALLAGCMSYGYDYRGGRSDYYYGQPSADYRYYGSGSGYGYGGPYGSIGYGQPGGFYGGVGYGSPYGYSRYGYAPRGYYGSPYGYYNGYGYPYPYYRAPIVIRRPVDGSNLLPRRPDKGSVAEFKRSRRSGAEPAPWSAAPDRPTIQILRSAPLSDETPRERRLKTPERDQRLEQTP